MGIREIAKLTSNKGSATDPKMYTPRIRQGTVVVVNANDTYDITLGGSATTITGVAVLESCYAQVGDSVQVIQNGTDLLVIGRVNTGQFVPFAMAAGTVALAAPGAVPGGATGTVTFPTGRFTVAPIVTVTMNNSNATPGSCAFNNILSTGCGVTFWQTNGAATARTLNWTAIQMTATSASG